MLFDWLFGLLKGSLTGFCYSCPGSATTPCNFWEGQLLEGSVDGWHADLIHDFGKSQWDLFGVSQSKIVLAFLLPLLWPLLLASPGMHCSRSSKKQCVRIGAKKTIIFWIFETLGVCDHLPSTQAAASRTGMRLSGGARKLRLHNLSKEHRVQENNKSAFP